MENIIRAKAYFLSIKIMDINYMIPSSQVDFASTEDEVRLYISGIRAEVAGYTVSSLETRVF